MSFGNLKIPQKLMAVFAVMLATIMAMGVALYVNKVNLGHSVERTERAYEMLRAADTAAFRLTRQENSLRGFLLSGDPYYVKRLEEAHKPKFLKALDKIKTLADGDTEDLARVTAVETAYANYRKKAIEPGEQLGADPATRPQAVELVRNDGVADQAVGPVEDAIEAITKNAEEELATEAAAQQKASLQSTIVLAVGILVTAGIAIAGGLLLTGAIARPVAAMTNAMRRLAAGDNSVAIPAMGRKDEIGDMAGAVVYFKDAAIEKIRIEQAAAEERQAAEGERAANEAEKAADREALAAEMIDRFGPLPPETDSLLKVVAIKGLCREANVAKIDVGPKGAVASFRNDEFANPLDLMQFVAKNSLIWKVRPDQKVVVKGEWETPAQRLDAAEKILTQLAKLAKG